MEYRREIDGLRAVAVLPVILFHAGFEVFSGGFVGVDVFFVISGFLITSILIDELERDDFSIARFYERRARRILPALFVVLLACIPFAWMWMLPSEMKDFAESVAATVLFSSNILFWSESGYFDTAAELKPLLHTWSLAVEEQYYLLFPLLLSAFWRFGRNRVFALIVAIAAFSLLLSEYGWRRFPEANFFLAPTRAWELLAGSICAFLTVGRTQRSSNMLATVGLTLIVFSIFYYDKTTPFPSLYALAPVGGTALIILYAHRETFVARLLSTAPFVGVGLISYSAYLWHQPLFAFARIRSLTEPSQALMGGLAIASLLLAVITWKYVEQPSRKRTGSLLPTRRGVFVASASMGAALVAIGIAVHQTEGAPQRFTKEQLALLTTADISPKRGRCHYNKNNQFNALNSCIYFDGPVNAVVYGNSHGVELAYGLAGILAEEKKSLMHFTISGCPPGFKRTISDYCDQFYEDRLKYILSSDVKNIVLTFRAEGAGEEGAGSIIELANHLTNNGKNVILVLQAPILKADIRRYMRIALVERRENIPSLQRNEWQKINKHIYSRLDRLEKRVQVIDLADSFCSNEVCYAVMGNNAMYFDDDHMSVTAAKKVAKTIAAFLKKASKQNPNYPISRSTLFQ